jgi:hypothetical protein
MTAPATNTDALVGPRALARNPAPTRTATLDGPQRRYAVSCSSGWCSRPMAPMDTLAGSESATRDASTRHPVKRHVARRSSRIPPSASEHLPRCAAPRQRTSQRRTSGIRRDRRSWVMLRGWLGQYGRLVVICSSGCCSLRMKHTEGRPMVRAWSPQTREARHCWQNWSGMARSWGQAFGVRRSATASDGARVRSWSGPGARARHGWGVAAFSPSFPPADRTVKKARRRLR